MSKIKDDADEVSIKEIINGIRYWILYLLSKWKLLVFLGLLGSFLGLGYASLQKPLYTASTNFVLEDGEGSGSGLGSLGGLASLAGVNIGGSGGGLFQGDNILELYKSRKMIQKTLLSEVEVDGKNELLIELYIKSSQKNDSSSNKKISFRTNSFTRVQDSLIKKFVKDINFGVMKVSKPDKKLNIIKVEVSHVDEKFAKLFNEKIVSNVNDFYVETKTKKANQNLAVVQKQTDSVRAELYGAINASASVADATLNLNPARQILRSSAHRSQFNAEASKAVLSTLLQNLELAKLSLMNETPLIQMIDHPIYPLEVKKLGKAKAMVSGGLILGFLSVFVLIIRKVLTKILND